MMPAAKMMDPVMGVDIHIVQPPGPVPPVPIPHPFIGMLIDPMDLVPIVGATVLINGMPRAIAGTAGKAIPPHIPIGGVFVKPPASECEMFMGSATVVIDGDPASYMALPALSCQDVGMIPPPRTNPKKKTKIKSMVLPTSVVIAIPMGMPVLIGGPPTISMMGMAQKLGGAALGKAWKKYKKAVKGSDRTAAFAKRCHNAAKKAMKKLKVPPSVQKKVTKAICTVTGHPVDVATGKVFTDTVDFELPGPIPLEWERTWYSSSDYAGPLGHNWHHPYDIALRVDGKTAALRMADGRPLGLPAVAEGETYFNRQEGLTFGRDLVGYYVEDKEGLRMRFHKPDPEGNRPLASIENPSGHAIRFEVDAQGRLVRIHDSAGRPLVVQNDTLGRITAIYAEHPDQPGKALALVRYVYDDKGQMSRAINPLGHAWKYEYRHRLLVKETNRNGLSFYFEWDREAPGAKCLRTWGDGGIYDHKLKYNEGLQTTEVTDSLGHRTVYHWNDSGVVWKTVNALGHSSFLERNAFQEVESETDELGFVTKYEYDERGNLVTHTEPEGSLATYLYDRDSLIGATDPDGGVWRWEYDSKGLLVRREDPLGSSLRYGYADGHLVSMEYPDGGRAEFEYDAHGNLVRLAQPDGSGHAFEYDRLGRCLASVDALGNRQTFAYDVASNLVRETDPDGHVREYEFDAEGELVRYRDSQQEFRMEYAGMGRLSARIEGGRSVRFEYDTEEQLVCIRNEAGTPFRFTLNALGDLVEERTFGGAVRRYSRDPKSRVVRVEESSGRSVDYAYDACDRLIAAAHDGDVETYRYRKDGLLVGAANANGTLEVELDALGRVLRESAGGHWVDSEWDAMGQRVSLASSMGASIRVRYDSMGDFEEVEASAGGGRGGPWRASIRRDALGQELERALPGGVKAVWERDRYGRPVSHRISGKSMSRSREYGWDPNDRLKSIRDSQFGLQEFEYDPQGQMISSVRSGKAVLRMPDAVGNLFRSGERGDRTYGEGGELLESRQEGRVARYVYDEDGRLLRKSVEKSNGRIEVWEYSWDAVGRLSSVKRPDGREVRFGYDPLGRRIWKESSAGRTRWVWDGNVPLHEWFESKPSVSASPASAPTGPMGITIPEARIASHPSHGPPGGEDRFQGMDSATLGAARDPGSADGDPMLGTPEAPVTWVFEPDSFAPMAKLVGGREFAIHTDHLGTPIAMTDEEGIQVWSADLDPFGLRTVGHGPALACPFRFPGQYEDAETGLYYNRFRYYDPDAGGYLSPDPIGLRGGMRAYAYSPDPNLWCDPLGLALSNKQMGDVAEMAARDHLKNQGHTVIGAIENKSGHGVDIVSKNPAGEIEVHEVKANGSRLNQHQKKGANSYGRRQAQRAGKPGFKHKHAESKKATKALQQRAAASRKHIKGQVIRVKVDPKTGKVKSIKSKPWKKCK